jgi:hypothetical protein
MTNGEVERQYWNRLKRFGHAEEMENNGITNEGYRKP